MSKKIQVIPHSHNTGKADRQKLLQQKSVIVWLTGLSGSGKSTIAGRVEEKLFQLGYKTYLLDGDSIRTGLNNNLSFTEEDRKENIRRIGEVAKLFVDAGIIVIAAFISPFISDRKSARNLVAKDEFVEVFVNCPIEICEQRDPKKLYDKAKRGEISNFTGISSPFEVPTDAEIEIHSDKISADEAANQILEFILPKIKY